MTETAKGFNVRLDKLPTPTEARSAYSQVAAGALKGTMEYEGMDEIGKEHITDDTAYVIAITLYKYGGRLLRTSWNVAWTSLNQSYFPKNAHTSAFGRFRKILGEDIAQSVYKTAFAMLESGVDTREALVALRKPPPDVLEGMRDSLRRTTEDDLVEIEKRSRRKAS